MYPKYIAFFYVIVPALCLALYLHGFFPLKATLPGHAELKNVSFNGKTVVQPSPVFDKLVIILIDALRSDFVLKGNSMTHLGEIMLNNGGVSFEVRAHPPTVTLPRIKAITTGTIPGFIDVVLNFDSSALEEDNLVTQMKRAGKRIVFYGDDTWLKLFPDHFARSDGTTSFFVSDYTQVDNNVTRHLDTELTDLDWDMMILHYLGLDHIGHLEGPHSPLVGPKLQEMDEIIHRVYAALEKQSDRSLILVCGDHGMSDHGGHGGASESEILVPAVFISPQFKKKGKAALGKPNRSLMQTDIASTLSILMGLPITNNNLGQVLQEVLAASGADIETILEILYFNSLQVVQLMKANVPSYKHEASYEMFLDVSKLHSEYLSPEDREDSEVNAKQLLYLYETTLEALTDRISSSLTRYDMYQLMIAPVVMLLAFVAVILMSRKVNALQTLSLEVQPVTFWSIPLASYMIWHVMACSSNMFYSTTMCSWGTAGFLWHLVALVMIIGSVSSIKVLYKMDSSPSKDLWPKTMVTKLLLLGTILHSLTYVSSSNIEEEHQTCYFLVNTFFCVITVRTLMVYLHQAWILKRTSTCACGEIKCTKGITKDSDSELYSGLKSKDDKVVERFLNEIDKLRKELDVSEENRHRPSTVDQTTELSKHSKSEFGVAKDTNPVMSLTEDDIKSEVGGDKKKEDSKDATYYSTKLKFPLKELISLVVILMILRFLRSLNQTGNKWLDRPDVGDWLGRSENRLFMSIVVIAAMILLWAVIGIKYSFTEMLMVGVAMLSCYRHRAKTGAIQDFLNQITTVDKKSVGTIQFMIVYAIGGLLIFRNVLDLVNYRIAGWIDEKKKAKIKKSLVESVQQSLLMMMAIVLRTHNILYVVGLAFIETVMEVNLDSITLLPVPYLTMFCLWMGRASFFYQGNSNSLSSIDVAAGYAGHPHYQATIVTIQLFVTTYAGPIFWFIVLLKYIYLQSQRCDKGTESPRSRLKTSLFLSVMTLVLERLFTLLLYTSVTTLERYHLFVWTVFSPKLLYEGMFTLLSAMVSLVFLCLQ